MKKALKIIGIVFILLIAVAFAAPFFLKDKIIAIAKEQINKNINAKVDFKKVDVSFFRHFPKLAVALDELQVVGIGEFSEDTLASVQRLDAALNIMSVVSGDKISIYSVTAESPRVHAIISKEGKANWDIMKPDTSIAKKDTAASSFSMKLNRYEIRHAYISYEDKQSGMSAEITDLNHSGSGDFSADVFTLKTTTSAEELTYCYNNIPFLYKVKAGLDADIQVDNKQHIYSYSTDKILLNGLHLGSKAIIKDLAEKGYDMDIQFKADAAGFKSILSLVPAVYKKDFDKVRTSGTAQLNGYVRGVYNDTHIPSYHASIEIKDGFFQYPDLPRPVKDINLSVQVDNADGQTDNTVVNLSKGHIAFDNDPFDFRLLLKKPISDMFIDAAAKGKLDLSKLVQFVKLDAGTKLTGLLDADINLKGNVSDIEKKQYDKFSAGGTVLLTNFNYASKDYPTGVAVNTLKTVFTSSKIDIPLLEGKYLNTGFTASGQINNLLNYVLQKRPLNASFILAADKVNLNDWMGTSPDTATAGPASAPFIVPAGLDVSLATKVSLVHYDKLDIQNLSGALQLSNETVFLKDIKGNALDGNITVNGSYSTLQSKTRPEISLDYKVEKVDVQKTFYAFNTVQKLMPIGKFIAGKLTSQLSVKGKIGENMMPDMNTLTGNGDLLLLDGFLSKFAPLDKMAATLNVKSMEQVSLKDVKNYFEFSNGKLLVKPFAVKTGGIDMEIGGLQGFDQSLDFLVNMKLPRALMGEKGNQLVNNLVSQVNAKGVPVKVGETVNLNLKLGGFMNSPVVKTDIKQGAANLTEQLKQQTTEFVKAKADSAKKAVVSAVKDTVSSLKKQALGVAKDELMKQLSGNKTQANDSAGQAKPNIKESAKGLLNNLFKKKP